MGDDSRQANACARCQSAQVRLVVRRVNKMATPGFVDLYQCDACGLISQRDTPIDFK